MLSLKPFLQRDENAREPLVEAQQRMIVSLLAGMVVHAVRGDPEDYDRLDSDLASIRNDISRDQFSSADLLIATGVSLKSLQDYNRRTGSFVQAQSAELQKITGMLTRAIVGLSVEGSASVSRLQTLERQLETTIGIQDVRVLKEKLQECLTGLREEKLRQKHSSETTVRDLNEGLSSIRGRETPSDAGLDGITGLGTRPVAERAIALAADGNEAVCAAIFVIDHLHSLNARYGRAVGDQTIMMFAQHIAQFVRPEDQVFRWSGPAFLALLNRQEGPAKICRELTPLVNARLELNVESRGRAVLLPINFSWRLVPIPLSGKAGAVVDRLDTFLSGIVGSET